MCELSRSFKIHKQNKEQYRQGFSIKQQPDIVNYNIKDITTNSTQLFISTCIYTSSYVHSYTIKPIHTTFNFQQRDWLACIEE